MCILTGIPYVHNHNQTDIFISQDSTHDINQMRSYQFGSQFKIYIGSHQEFRFNNMCVCVLIIILVTIKHDHQSMIKLILTNKIFIIFLMHIENYRLTWLESKQNSKTDTEGNPTNVPPVNYQDYLNTKKTYSIITQKNI
jgi:ABC-type transport system involved in cytochrome bd biosynthesis fused ATPase/permease subunit